MQISREPKAFISHSHVDLASAEKVARYLRSNGINAWFAGWEIEPGDSLVQRIFNEGLSQTDCFIILVSKHSVRSTWVREELDNATIRRIEGSTRIVPIRLDDTAIPQPLKALKWVDLTGDFDRAMRDLVMTIFGMNERPPIGSPPNLISNASPLVVCHGDFCANSG